MGAGDYPWYDLDNSVDCRTSRQVTLFGDYNMWWVFNDKGNIHTETNGDPIGMEIRAQAFAFATNDEINNMTFYNYEMINRSTQTLTETYFAVYLDPDIGCSEDDYVGCDVQRGLGYQYNADAIDNDGVMVPKQLVQILQRLELISSRDLTKIMMVLIIHLQQILA